MQKLRPYVLPGIFVFHLLTVWVVFSTISPLSDQNNPTSLELVRILVCLLALTSQFFLTALGAGWGAGSWVLRIPSWGALAALTWFSFIFFATCLDGKGPPDDALWEVALVPLIGWIVLVAFLLFLRVIPFLKWQIALQPMPPDSQSRQPHKDSVTRGILIVVAAWAGVMIMVKDSWPWSEMVAELSGSSEHLFALGGAAALFGAGALSVAMLMVGLTLTRFADWLFYRRLWTLPLAATLLTGCAIVLLLSFGGPFKNGSERLLAGLWLLASLATQPLATLLVIGMAGYRLAPRQQPIPQNSEPSSPAATTVTEKPVANWLLRLQRAHFAALLGVLAFFVGYVPTGALDQHYLRINFGGTATGHLELRRWTTIDSFRAISKLDNLQSLDFTASRITDDDLVHLQGLTNLKTLLLSDKTTDAGLTHIRGLTNLQALWLVATQVSDAGLVHLEALTNLQRLYLRHTQVSDAGLVHLEALTNLESLYLDSTQITDVGLLHLKEMTNLRVLNLDDNLISDAGLVHLKGLSNLEALNLGDTRVSDKGLVHLQRLTRLQHLNLDDTLITDAGLIHLQRLTRMQRLFLSDNKISNAGLVHIKGMSELEILYLNSTQVTAAGFAELQKALPNCRINY